MGEDQEKIDKVMFGIALAQSTDDPFKVACGLFGADRGKALEATTAWLRDPVVIEARDSHRATHGPATLTITKEELATKVILFAEEKFENGNYRHESKDRLTAYKLYADIMGFIEKPSVAVNNNIQQNSLHVVMKTTDYGTDDQWEQSLKQQQTGLVQSATSAITRQ